MYPSAAHHLSGDERLDLIERPQAAHAEIEAPGRQPTSVAGPGDRTIVNVDRTARVIHLRIHEVRR